MLQKLSVSDSAQEFIPGKTEKSHFSGFLIFLWSSSKLTFIVEAISIIYFPSSSLQIKGLFLLKRQFPLLPCRGIQLLGCRRQLYCCFLLKLKLERLPWGKYCILLKEELDARLKSIFSVSNFPSHLKVRAKRKSKVQSCQIILFLRYPNNYNSITELPILV